MAGRKKDERPCQYRAYFEYKGRVLPIESFPKEDRDKAMSIACIKGLRIMNPGWNVELKPEAREIDLEAYFKDAPTVGSLFSTKEAQERVDAEYRRRYAG